MPASPLCITDWTALAPGQRCSEKLSQKVVTGQGSGVLSCTLHPESKSLSQGRMSGYPFTTWHPEKQEVGPVNMQHYIGHVNMHQGCALTVVAMSWPACAPVLTTPHWKQWD